MKTANGKYPVRERPKAIRIYYDMEKLKDYVYCRLYIGPLGNSEHIGNLCIPVAEWNWFKSKDSTCYYIPDTQTVLASYDTPTIEMRD